ncbi:MAG: DUF3426 domain-containing protein [Variovorax sp.]|nr:MAG: DUF3426 domain-containing protein [Variovorax sp.]
MSLVTRCPSCATTFKVVRDQLRISDGWVRCGRCSNVFDATLDLQESPDAVPAEPAPAADEPGPPGEPALPPEPEPEPESEPEPEAVAPPPSPPPVWPDIGVIADEPWPNTPAQAESADPAPALSQASLARSIKALDDFSAVVDQAADAQLQKALRRARIEAVRNARARKAAEAHVVAAPGPLPRAPSPPSPQMPVVTAASAIESDAEPAASPIVPLIDAPANAHRWWPKGKSHKRAVWIAAFMCALLLGLQLLRHERDTIVARQPSLRPVMSALCAATGCELSALRQIGAITIDGAAFAREKTGDGYRLNFTLRNAVAVPLAMPAVELSLLDTQERAVVRRVLMPTDFGAPAVLPARAERSVSLPLVLTGPEAAALPPLAGYSVVAFYP